MGFVRTTPVSLTLAALAMAGCAQASLAPVGSPPSGSAFIHAHNDYEHAKPLVEALDAGARSVEADVHVIDGELLVAHDAKQVVPDRTLRSLYLEPLRRRITSHGGSVYGDGRSVVLLVDFKGDADATYAVLRPQLAEHASMFTRYSREGKVECGPVTVVLTGNQPSREKISAEPTRLVAFDGALADLDRDPAPSPDLVPLVSANWKQVFKWNGRGTAPDAEVRRLQAFADKSRAQGRTLRFWGAPDTPAMWRTLLDCHVDWVNTDKLADVAKFLRPDHAATRPG